MDRRGDERAGSEQQVSARPPGRGARPHTGPDTGEQFAALDVLIGIAQQQDRARRQEAAAARLPHSGPAREDGRAPEDRRTDMLPGRQDHLTALLPGLDAGDADQDSQADGGRGTKTARRGRMRALGRRTLALLSIPGARRSTE